MNLEKINERCQIINSQTEEGVGETRFRRIRDENNSEKFNKLGLMKDPGVVEQKEEVL